MSSSCDGGTTLLEARGLGHTYAKAVRPALELEHLKLEGRGIYGLLGPNGSGKSTLFKILSTQIVDFTGSVTILGTQLQGGGVNGTRELRAKLGVTFQDPSLDPLLTVEENLYVQGALYGIGGSALAKRCDEMLETFELKERRRERVKTLSGGFARRVELAKALLHGPEFLLLDEPTTGVDAHLRLRFWETLRHLVTAQNVSLLVSTHLMEEAELCDELVILDQGRVVDQGSPESLRSAFAHDVVELRIEGLHERESLLALGKTLLGKLPEGSKSTVRGELLRFEVGRGLTVLPMIESHLGTKLKSMQWGRPTLEDVFLSKTGRSLHS